MDRKKIISKANTVRRRLRAAYRQLNPKKKPGIPTYTNGNKVINHPRLDNARIIFKGKNNILYCESADTILSHCIISFEGNNGVVYLSRHYIKNRKHRIKIYVKSGATVFIGQDVNFHLGGDSMSYITASEARNVIIGNDCLFSLNAWFRTSDGHAAYDGQTKKRINGAASILIGDHVWLGQDVTVLKGSRIGSGSIIGAGSIVTGKTLSSNTSCAGAPARELKNNIFFTKPNINGYDQQKLETIATEDTDEWMYKRDENTLSFDEIDKDLSELQTSAEKLAYFRKNLAGKASKNRFYIGDDKKIS